MIVYSTGTWFGPFAHVSGTVLPGIFFPVLSVAIWAYVVSYLQKTDPEVWAVDMGVGNKVLGGFVTFFSIFRMQQAFNRYWISNGCLKEIQVVSRELHQQMTVYPKGGALAKKPEERDAWEQAATDAKADGTRYIMAFCIAFKLHTRIAYCGYCQGFVSQDTMTQVDCDRARLRGLLTHEEFAIVDNMIKIERRLTRRGLFGPFEHRASTEPACRPCHVLIFLMRSVSFQSSVENKTWGWLERSLNLTDVQITKLMHAFEEMDQACITPLPLPYSHLGKWLLMVFMFLFPIVGLSHEDGYVMKVFWSILISAAMFGVETISMELENPFGEGLNDFDTMRIIASIEGSIWNLLTVRNDPCLDSFDWIQSCDEYDHCDSFICLRDSVPAVLEMMPGATNTHKASKAAETMGSVMENGHWHLSHGPPMDTQPWQVQNAQGSQNGMLGYCVPEKNAREPEWRNMDLLEMHQYPPTGQQQQPQAWQPQMQFRQPLTQGMA